MAAVAKRNVTVIVKSATLLGSLANCFLVQGVQYYLIAYNLSNYTTNVEILEDKITEIRFAYREYQRESRGHNLLQLIVFDYLTNLLAMNHCNAVESLSNCLFVF